MVDIFLNKGRTGKAVLFISSTEEVNNSLCLKPKLLRYDGILFYLSTYDNYLDSEEHCYRLGDESHTRVDFYFGTQFLKFSAPQVYLMSKRDVSLWDYGDNGARLKYYGNFNKNNNDKFSAFGNLELGVNIERLVLSSKVNVSKRGGKNELSMNDLTLSRAISQIQGDLILGKSQARSTLFSDVGFYGIAIRSNNMCSFLSRGDAPVMERG